MLPEEGLTSAEWKRAAKLSESAFHRNRNALVEIQAVHKNDDGYSKPMWGMAVGDGEEHGE